MVVHLLNGILIFHQNQKLDKYFIKRVYNLVIIVDLKHKYIEKYQKFDIKRHENLTEIEKISKKGILLKTIMI